MEDNYVELSHKLSKLQWLMQRSHLHNHAEHGPMADPTRGQGRVLAVLKLQPEITTKDLSYLLGIRQQSLNELLGKLEKAGYVTRVPSEADRRVMIVTLTEKGRGAQQPQAESPGIFDCLSEAEQTAFAEYLDRVMASLESRLSAEDRENIENWMEAAKSRMGSEQFERLMAMRGGMPFGREGWWGERFGHGFSGFGYGGHGHMSHNMSGAERFDPDYDGPMPDGRGPHPHGRCRGDRPNPPSPPPKNPHDPDDDQ